MRLSQLEQWFDALTTGWFGKLTTGWRSECHASYTAISDADDA